MERMEQKKHKGEILTDDTKDTIAAIVIITIILILVVGLIWLTTIINPTS